MSDHWVQTFSGVRFDLVEPTPDMVELKDIAHSLARLQRFNGHTTAEHYSVAEHSILVAALVLPMWKRDALLHDAAEAYIGDIVRPLKDLLGAQVREIEGVIHAAIAKRFGVGAVVPNTVKEADLVMLATERREIMAKCEHDWSLPFPALPKDPGIRHLPPRAAEQAFLEACKAEGITP